MREVGERLILPCVLALFSSAAACSTPSGDAAVEEAATASAEVAGEGASEDETTSASTAEATDETASDDGNPPVHDDAAPFALVELFTSQG